MGLERFRDISGRGGGSPPRRRFPGGSGGGSGGEDPIGRVPPHSIEAEMAVLGAMLLGDRTAVERAMELTSRDDFYRDAHGYIFDAMASLNGKGEPIDIITLQNEMNQLGTLEGIGIEYLLQLSDIEFTTSNIAYYAQIVAEKATLRRLIEAASRIASQAYGEVDEVTDLVDQAERAIFEVARKRSGQGFTPLRPLLTEVFEKLDTVYQDKGVVTGVDTGFNDLNAMTSGLQEGDLFILAARPSMGKTSLAMGIGQNACLKNRSVAVFSLEMSKEQLVQRLICSEARVDAHRMRTGYLHDSDWDSISAAVQRLWDANLFIDDATEMSALEMRARCRRLQAEYGLDLVIVDYLQLMRGSGRADANRNEEITTIARGLKGMARELRVPVVALSQLSRAVERREDKRPMLSDLRESGAIEAEADLVAFIYRPAYYERKQEFSKDAQDKAEEQESGGGDGYQGEEAEIIIAKHRNGPTGTVKMAFLPKYARFDNLSQHGDSPF
jgi:replicative DNA helicase